MDKQQEENEPDDPDPASVDERIASYRDNGGTKGMRRALTLAVAEVDRLRAENQRLRYSNDTLAAVCERQSRRLEIARKTASALLEIAETP